MMTGELQLFVDYCHLVTSNHVTHAHMTKHQVKKHCSYSADHSAVAAPSHCGHRFYKANNH